MATKRTKQTSKKKTTKKKTEATPIKINANNLRITIGVTLIVLSLLLLISFISFFFTGDADYSIINSNKINSNITAKNYIGRFGAYFADLFINSGIGISAFILVFCIFVIALRIIKIQLLPLGKTIRHSIFIGIWLSAVLGYIFSFQADTSHFLPGGVFGFFISSWLVKATGNIGFIVIALALLIIYLSFTFDNFVPAIKKLFNKETNNQNTNTELVKTKEPNYNSEKEFEFSESDNDDKKHSSSLFETTYTAQKDDEENIEKEENKDIINSNTSSNDNKTEIKLDISENTGSDTESNDEFEINRVTNEEEATSQAKIPQGDYDPTLDLSDYTLPPIDLLEDHRINKEGISQEELNSNKDKIVNTLIDYKIEIKSIKATVGPTVTLYEIIPAPGIRISKIKNLEDDIALSLAALGIRIIAPMPGKGTIGIEVPNSKPEIVSMRSIIKAKSFQESKYELPIALGKTISNETFVLELAKAPHMLVAGATGQGKSVGLNAIITSLLYKKHPSQIKFVLVDPKKVELNIYSKIERHFLAKLPGEDDEAIITDVQKVVTTLNSLAMEMDSRYDLLKMAHARNIKEYNHKFVKRSLNPEKGHRFLPYIILVIDEFADLIMTAGKEVETPIARIAQLARAVGIHMIVATQRPSTNIITGVIKANFPTRIAFKVTSMIDSRTILDSPGANQLIGRGDMLISQGSDLIRVQCAFVDTPEVERINDYIGSQRGYPEAFKLPEFVGDTGENDPNEADLSNRDSLFEDAAKVVITNQSGSTSLLQRRFSIGYNRAGRIMDQLEAARIVGPFEGGKTRKVLIDSEEMLARHLEHL